MDTLKKADFYEDLIKYNTENYEFIVIDKLNTKSNNFEDKVFKIKAKV